MAFKLSVSPTYTWPVKLVLPEDGGHRSVHTFDAQFRRLSQSRIDELSAIGREMAKGEIVGDYRDQDVVRELLSGWDGITDDSGKAIPFSEAALAQVIEIPTVAGQIVKAWLESLTEAKRKN